MFLAFLFYMTMLTSALMRGPAFKYTTSRLSRASSVADPVLLCGGHFRCGLAKFWDQKNRIIAKTILPARTLGDYAFDCAFDHAQIA